MKVRFVDNDTWEDVFTTAVELLPLAGDPIWYDGGRYKVQQVVWQVQRDLPRTGTRLMPVVMISYRPSL